MECGQWGMSPDTELTDAAHELAVAAEASTFMCHVAQQLNKKNVPERNRGVQKYVKRFVHVKRKDCNDILWLEVQRVNGLDDAGAEAKAPLAKKRKGAKD